MKKKLFVIGLVFLLVAGVAYARMNAAFIGIAGVVAEAGGSETYSLFYNADHASGDYYAYTSGGSGSLEATNYSTTVVAGGTDPGTSSADGGNVLKVNGWNQRIRFSNTSSLFSSAKGLLEFEYYYTESHENLDELLYITSTTDRMAFTKETDNTIKIYYRAVNPEVVLCTAQSTATVSAETWTKVYARWDVSAETCGVKVGASSWVDASASGMTEFANEPTEFGIGSDNSGIVDRPAYFDGLKVWTSYDGS